MALTMDDVSKRLGIGWYRFGALVEAGAIPRARLIGGQTGWDWKDIEQSSFMLDPGKWNASADTYGPLRIYFIGINEFVKIGYSGNVKERITTIRQLSPYNVELLHSFPGDQNVEAYLHDRFQHLRHRGEWFRKEREIWGFIEAHKNDPGTLVFVGGLLKTVNH